MKEIALIFGGISSEHHISIESAYSVYQHIDHSTYHITPIYISKTGTWHKLASFTTTQSQDLLKDNATSITLTCNPCQPGFISNNPYRYYPIHTALIVMHGKNGEDGSVGSACHLSGIKVCGCCGIASILALDKYRSHLIANSIGITTAKSRLLTLDTLDSLEEKISSLNFPLFVKPNKAGSSYGIRKVNSYQQLKEAINYAFSYDDEVMIEETISGYEVGVGILEDNHHLIIGSIDRIEIHNDFYDLKEKYNACNSIIHNPSELDQNLQNKIREVALNLYHIHNCKGFARIDLFIKDDETIIFNEINTIPGFTSNSRFPTMMKLVGINFTNCLTTIIENAY